VDAGAIAVFIPIVAVSGFFAWMISLSPVGKAYAERMRRQHPDPAAGARHEELVAVIEDLRREVAELAERVDFTERLLAKTRAQERLSPPDRVSG
jgi:hypothetical protein